MAFYKDLEDKVYWLDAGADPVKWLPVGSIEIDAAEAKVLRAALAKTKMPQMLRVAAQQALAKTDDVAMRCWKAGVAFPDDWKVYTTALRCIVNGSDTGSTALPTQPAYPAGT